MPNTNLENAKTNMKSRIRNRAAISSTPRDLGRLAKSARFVGLIDDSEVESELDTQMASAIPAASIDDLVSLSEGINELRDRRPALGGMTSTDQMVEGSRKFLHANSVQPAISVSGDLSYENGVVSYTTPTSAALQVVATVGDLPAGASAGDQAVVQSNNKLYIKTAEGWYAVALINTAPSVSGNDATYELATDGTPTVITLTATDPENDPVTFSHSVSSGDLNGTTVNQADNVFTVTPHGSNPATFELTFSANDTVNVATVVSSFTLAFALTFDYTNALTNSVTIEGNHFGMGDGVFATRSGNIVFSGDGYSATGRYIRAWNLDNPQSPNQLWENSAANAVFATWFPTDGTSDYIAVLKQGGSIYILNVSDGSVKVEIPISNVSTGGNPAWRCATFAEDGQSIYCGLGRDQGPDLYNVWPVYQYDLDGNLLGTLDYVENAAFARSHFWPYFGVNIAVGTGFVAVMASKDLRDGAWNGNRTDPLDDHQGRIHIYDPATRNRIAVIQDYLPQSQRHYNDFGDSGRWMDASGTKLILGLSSFSNYTGSDYPFFVYDMSDPSNPTLQHTHTIAAPQSSKAFGMCQAVGNYAFVHNRGGIVKVLNLTSNTVDATVDYPNGANGRFCASSDGHIVTGEEGYGSKGAIHIYPANT